MLKTLVAAALSLAFAGQAGAQSFDRPVATGAPGSAQITTSDDRFYPASVDGIGEYLDELKQSDMQLYRSLRPRYDELRHERFMARAVMAASAGVGLGLVGYGLTKTKDKDFGLTPTLAGTGVLIAGVFTGIMLTPSQDDLRAFINNHNRRNQRTKLRFDIGVDGGKRAPTAQVAIGF